MSYINNNQTGTIAIISDNVIQVNGLSLSTNGFNLYAKGGFKLGDYSEYTTLYRTIDAENKIYQYSNDNSIYVAPIIPEPTAEELAEIEKQNKIATLQSQLNSCEQELSNGDYKIIKLYEYSLAGKTCDEYNIETLNTERDALRTKINELNTQIKTLQGE